MTSIRQKKDMRLDMRSFVVRLRHVVSDARTLCRLPKVDVHLMRSTAKSNLPFYQHLVDEFFRATRRRHRKFPLVGAFSVGIALCRLPKSFADYFAAIDAAGRRNFKKAMRLGYEWRRIQINDHLEDVAAIRQSATVRQGPVPDELLNGSIKPCSDPPSLSPVHDYPYFGVLRDGRLVAYAGCFCCGEVCLIEQILGHASHQPDGVVPQLIVGLVRHLIDRAPWVRYCVYDTYFAARPSLRRFKQKFLFKPHVVAWHLE